MLTDLWNIAGGTEENDVDAQVILVLFAAILKLEVPQIFKPEFEGQFEEKSVFKIDRESGKVFFSDFNQIVMINKKFMSFSQNRKGKKRERGLSQGPDLTFSPMINDNSRMFADKKMKDQGLSKEEHFKKLYRNKPMDEYRLAEEKPTFSITTKSKKSSPGS